MIKLSTIKHLSNGKWQVVSHTGRSLGTYDTKEEAEERLAQVEMFKHMDDKKSAWLFILYKMAKKQEEPTSTYSATMREINKNNPELREEFMRKFKDAFDMAIEKGLQDPQTLALMEAKKSLGSNINYRLLKLAQIARTKDPAEVGRTLAAIVKIILTKLPYDSREAYENIRQKIMNLNTADISRKELPGTAAYGQALTLIKTMLHGYDQQFISKALSSLVKNLY